MNELKISVVIPVYNREALIVKCLDSLAEQSLSQHVFEVIVVDDCSTDNTAQIVDNYSKLDNLRLIVLSENSGGASKPRNTGIDLALGKYTVFIDSDDTITSDALELALNLGQKEDLDMVIIPIAFGVERNSYTALFEEHPNGIQKALFSKNKEISRLVFSNPGIIGRLYRTKLLQHSGVRFSERLNVYEDTLFSRFVFSICESVGMIPVATASYIPAPISSELNLSLLRRNVARCVNYLTEAISMCQQIPDSIISLERKNRILNNSFCRNNIFNTVNTAEGHKELGKHLDILLPYLYRDGIRTKAKELISKVCRVKSLEENAQLASNYFEKGSLSQVIAPHYLKTWVWKDKAVVIDFDVQGARIGVDIHLAIEGYHLIELILRGNSRTLNINWGKFGHVQANHVQIFYHQASLGLYAAFDRISQVVEQVAREIMIVKQPNFEE